MVLRCAVDVKGVVLEVHSGIAIQWLALPPDLGRVLPLRGMLHLSDGVEQHAYLLLSGNGMERCVYATDKGAVGLHVCMQPTRCARMFAMFSTFAMFSMWCTPCNVVCFCDPKTSQNQVLCHFDPPKKSKQQDRHQHQCL